MMVRVHQFIVDILHVLQFMEFHLIVIYWHDNLHTSFSYLVYGGE